MAMKPMSAEHKAALAEGRTHARAVRVYLEAIERNRPKRGRKRRPDSIKTRLFEVAGSIDGSAPLKRLQLIQERKDLEAELARLEADSAVDLSELEGDFIASASIYGAAKGISYAAWREIGVEPRVLAAAGITRSN